MPNLFESKRDALLQYAGWYGCTEFVETGTCQGDTVHQVYLYFDRVHSVELSHDFCQYAAARFEKANNVRIWEGDSGNVLKMILPILTGRPLFFLDAHYSGGYTAKGIDETPVMRELKSILDHSKKFDGVILIDDLKEFGTNPAYPTLGELQNFIKSHYPGLICDTIPEGGGMILIVDNRMKPDKKRKVKQVVPVMIEVQEQAQPEPDKHRWERAPILYGPNRNK